MLLLLFFLFFVSSSVSCAVASSFCRQGFEKSSCLFIFFAHTFVCAICTAIEREELVFLPFFFSFKKNQFCSFFLLDFLQFCVRGFSLSLSLSLGVEVIHVWRFIRRNFLRCQDADDDDDVEVSSEVY